MIIEITMLNPVITVKNRIMGTDTIITVVMDLIIAMYMIKIPWLVEIMVTIIIITEVTQYLIIFRNNNNNK